MDEARGVLRVGLTWDGRPVPKDEVAVVRLVGAGDVLEVVVDAPFHRDPPAPAPPGPTPGLWDYEAVELFVAGTADEGRPSYLEIEMSPHGHHLVLLFRAIRQPSAQGLPLDFEARVSGDRWRGVARVPSFWLPGPPLRGAAFALHGVGEGRQYLSSVALPGPRPDFHRPGEFPPLELPTMLRRS